MNYKIATFVLATLLAGAVVYIATISPVSKTKTSDGTAGIQRAFDSDLFLDEELYEHFSTINQHDRDTTGKFIDFATAEGIFNSYHQWAPLPHGTPNGQPYAFSVGINVMQKFLNRIYNINDSLKAMGDNNTIEAIRVHLARKKRISRPHLDILLMPALKDTRSYVRLNAPLTDRLRGAYDSTMVNTSAPCPTLCQ